MIRGFQKNKKGFTVVEAFFVLLLLAIIGSVFVYVSHSNPKVNSSTIIHDGAVTIKYVNMPGLKSYKAGKIETGLGGPIEESQGHYLYFDISNPCPGHIECGFSYKGNVVYDGKTVFSGMVNEQALTLSENGLHYVYDNKYVGSNGFTLALSSNGQQIGWADECSIYINFRVVYSVDNCNNSLVSGTDFSANLDHFITGVDTYTETNDGSVSYVIYDGKTLDNSAKSGDLDLNISPNGLHYIYASNGVIVVDGKTAATIPIVSYKIVYNTQVTDNGNYAYLECDENGNGIVFVNSQKFSSGSCDIENDKPKAVVINSDADHYFYFVGKSSDDNGILDGKPVKLSGLVDDIEFSGNTLYVYRWVN